MSWRYEWEGSQWDPKGVARLYVDEDPPVEFQMPDFATYHKLRLAIDRIEGDARSKAVKDIQRRVNLYCDAYE